MGLPLRKGLHALAPLLVPGGRAIGQNAHQEIGSRDRIGSHHGPVLGSGEGIPGLIGGAFTDFQSDPQAKTLSARLPAGGEAGFVTITPAVRVRSAQIIGDRLVVVYE